LIACCTSEGVLPAARIVPAYGTVMLPLESTIWFGSVTKLPGRAPASLGTNSPPGGSKIVTLTTSPMPSVILHGGGRRTLDVLALHPAFGAASYWTQRWCIKRASAAGVRAKTTPTGPATAETIALVRTGPAPGSRPRATSQPRTCARSAFAVASPASLSPMEVSHCARKAFIANVRP
jgi:hypothetical protein